MRHEKSKTTFTTAFNTLKAAGITDEKLLKNVLVTVMKQAYSEGYKYGWDAGYDHCDNLICEED